MKVDVSSVDVWAVSIKDRPGALTEKLDALAQADVDLEFIIARRENKKAGKGLVFVTPIKGPRQIRAARKAGFEKTKSLHGIRIATGNKPGYGAELAMRLAEAGINLRGLSGAAIGNRAILHIAFDSSDDARKAKRLLKRQ
ncbi:MAG: amino acid-binding protein [Planctomycetes bacterium]|nr:amino acid-binding protein [Planctomycetota bacterium]